MSNLTTLSFVVEACCFDPERSALIGGVQDRCLPLGFGGGAYQNCEECITAVVGIKIAHQFGLAA